MTIYAEYGHDIAIMGLLDLLQFFRVYAMRTNDKCDFDLFAIVDVDYNLDCSLDMVETRDHET